MIEISSYRNTSFFLQIKYSDCRVVEFKYMPDLALENARNVTIGLKGEHGQYVMVQIAFAAKWILISGIESLIELLFDYKSRNFELPGEN